MKTRTLISILILVLALLIITGSCATTPKTKEGKPECTILLDGKLEERPQEVKAAWASYGMIMEIQIHGYYSQHNTTDGFKMTFGTERDARAFLAEMWSQFKAEGRGVSDKYLDELLAVVNSGYLSEYVYVYFRQDFWPEVPDLKLDEFREWRTKNLKDHKVETLAIAVPKIKEERESIEPEVFLQSVKSGDYAEVKRLIEAGADINAKNNDGFPALIMALLMEHTEVATLLIEAGADVNAEAKAGYTALPIVAGDGLIEVVKLLVEKGADVNDRDNNGYTALFSAAKYGHTKIAQLLIDAGADVNAQSKEGATVLMFATEHGQAEFAKLLIETGADVNAWDN